MQDAFKPAPALIAVLIAVTLLAGCSLGPSESGVYDPFEAANRAQFERNLALERRLSGNDAIEASDQADTAFDTEPEPERPRPILRAVSNFGANLGTPSTVLNDLLQVRPDRAFENSLRFVINSTIGLAGIFDPATAMGIHGRDSDFGETLYRWGVGEGAYVVLPVFGPSTERDAAGMLVDALIDPWNFVLTRDELAAQVLARLGARAADSVLYSDLVDANVIDTADPYAQARLLYLQTRRYHLGATAEEEVIDPYADF